MKKIIRVWAVILLLAVIFVSGCNEQEKLKAYHANAVKYKEAAIELDESFKSIIDSYLTALQMEIELETEKKFNSKINKSLEINEDCIEKIKTDSEANEIREELYKVAGFKINYNSTEDTGKSNEPKTSGSSAQQSGSQISRRRLEIIYLKNLKNVISPIKDEAILYEKLTNTGETEVEGIKNSFEQYNRFFDDVEKVNNFYKSMTGADQTIKVANITTDTMEKYMNYINNIKTGFEEYADAENKKRRLEVLNENIVKLKKGVKLQDEAFKSVNDIMKQIVLGELAIRNRVLKEQILLYLVYLKIGKEYPAYNEKLEEKQKQIYDNLATITSKCQLSGGGELEKLPVEVSVLEEKNKEGKIISYSAKIKEIVLKDGKEHENRRIIFPVVKKTEEALKEFIKTET